MTSRITFNFNNIESFDDPVTEEEEFGFNENLKKYFREYFELSDNDKIRLNKKLYKELISKPTNSEFFCLDISKFPEQNVYNQIQIYNNGIIDERYTILFISLNRINSYSYIFKEFEKEIENATGDNRYGYHYDPKIATKIYFKKDDEFNIFNYFQDNEQEKIENNELNFLILTYLYIFKIITFAQYIIFGFDVLTEMFKKIDSNVNDIKFEVQSDIISNFLKRYKKNDVPLIYFFYFYIDKISNKMPNKWNDIKSFKRSIGDPYYFLLNTNEIDNALSNIGQFKDEFIIKKNLDSFETKNIITPVDYVHYFQKSFYNSFIINDYIQLVLKNIEKLEYKEMFKTIFNHLNFKNLPKDHLKYYLWYLMCFYFNKKIPKQYIDLMNKEDEWKKYIKED